MTRLDKQIHKGGFSVALSLTAVLLAALLVYHLITGFGLSYFYTAKNIGTENFSKGGAYARATVTEAYSVRRDTVGEYYICPCPDGRSTFILLVPTKYTDGFNKKITKGKTVKVKGQLTLLEESDKAAYLNMAQRIGHGYETGLIRSCRLDYMKFGDFFNKHVIINSIMCFISIMLLVFIIRFLVFGSSGRLQKSIRKYDYDLDSIRKDFEDAEKFGDLFIGSRFIVSCDPLDVFAADDIKSAYKKAEPSKYLKTKIHYVVLKATDGTERAVNCGSEKKAQGALEALQKFSYITIS